MGKIGWWNPVLGHEFNKRSIEHYYRDWPGWEDFMEMLEGKGIPPYLADSVKYATIMFETGCRIGETIQLKPEMFTWNEEAVIGWNVPLLKKGKKKRRATREVYIKLDDHNPLGYALVDYLEACKEGDYLLPGLTAQRDEQPWRHASRKTAYNRIVELHPDLFPHILRGFRAGMLVKERDFTVQQLVAWFDWKNADMAIHYTKPKDMAESMGIENLPLKRQPR